MPNAIDVSLKPYEIVFCHQLEDHSILFEIRLPSDDVVYMPGTRLQARVSEKSQALEGTVRRIKPLDRVFEMEIPLDRHSDPEIARLKAGDFFVSIQPSEPSDKDFNLGVSGFRYSDLYKPERLAALDQRFCAELQVKDSALAKELQVYRESKGQGMPALAESTLLIRLAPHVSEFLARLFHIEPAREQLLARGKREQAIFEMKFFVQRRALRKYKEDAAKQLDFSKLDLEVSALQRLLFPSTLNVKDPELGLALMVQELLRLEKAYHQAQEHKDAVAAEEEAAVKQLYRRLRSANHTPAALTALFPADSLDLSPDQELDFISRLLGVIEDWIVAATHDERGKSKVADWISFKKPESLDYQHLVQITRPRPNLAQLLAGPLERLRRRDGFKLTDSRYDYKHVFNEIDYCLYCHDRGKDSCSKGLHEKDGALKANPLGIPLAGCPLDEKISEAHLLKKSGDSIAALSAIIIDNPMLPGTGHRICNDCMKSCIFQKQEPVNIPQAETGILTDVLKLPYGFEIYTLLTRWNPLNVKRPYALPYNGKNVLVVGLGPAGYTLAHYLLNEGFGVVGIDGLKIEPLPRSLTGDENLLPTPIADWNALYHQLDQRILEGFGGVSEYGITVRWDKNFLTLLHLSLARRLKFRIFGGIRFGGTLSVEDAWDLGFHHIAIATGAGKPTQVGMKNSLIRGVRMASDFLMALQLTGAFKRNALANLQIQLPALVIGGGLTAIDTATELMAYYPIEVEKFLDHFNELTTEIGEEKVWSVYNPEEREIAERFLEHGRAVKAERQRALQAHEAPNFVPLVQHWGGVYICYRKSLNDSPAYRLNHEEVIKSLEEGIFYVEAVSPTEALTNKFGALDGVMFERQALNEKGRWSGTGEFINLPARSLMVAAGTNPNVIYERERPGTFELDERKEFFKGFRLEKRAKSDSDGDTGGEFELVAGEDAGIPAFFTSYHSPSPDSKGEGRYITYYGDNHPVFEGNVVKAMASAKFGYPNIVQVFEKHLKGLSPEDQPKREEQFRNLIQRLDEELCPRVVEVVRLTPTIVEVIVRARMQARKFRPGQFFRLQNYEVDSPHIDDSTLMMEGIALTGAWVDRSKGLLSMIVLEMGVSSRLVATLKPGQPVVVMGPTGTPTEIPRDETVLLAGGGLGNAVLFSIAKALKENKCRVIYFAGYKKKQDFYKREEIESSTDQVIYSVDDGDMIEAQRPGDRTFRGNIVQAMKSYADGVLEPQGGQPRFDFHEVHRIIAIGSDRMMGAVKVARRTVLCDYLDPRHTAIASINSPMQCMMKEVCAQCLQMHVDPDSGEPTGPVFSCFNQDQPMDEVDFKNLNDRLRQNTVQEKLGNLWFDHLLKKRPDVILV
ncbi:MAG: FAD-dependent oxidoreductase [Acidobacteriia bacterium]|nr:FAD-dependent oxidoreductase [Terriglobia bacterium]